MDASIPTSQEELIRQANEDAQSLFSDFQGPPTNAAELQELLLPVCLPQTTNNDTAPFVRAYSYELEASGVTMEDWLKFM